MEKVELILGKVELGFEDFLEIRAGMELIFEIPSQYQGSLLLDGKEWAKVEIKGHADELRLTICEVI